MNILQMVDVPWDSGLAHYALTLAQGLQRQGHAVWVSTIPQQKPWAKAQRMALQTVPLATWKSLPRLRQFLTREKIALINAHTGSTHSLAVLAALKQPIAVVRTRSDARAVRRTIGSGFLYKHTARVIAAAEYIRQDLLRTLKLPSEKVVTIGQGIDIEHYKSSVLPQAPVLGIVARLDPVKGHAYLLKALALLQARGFNLRLKVVGQSENVKEKDLQKLAARLGIESAVDFLGYQEDVRAVMRACTIGVIASTGSEAVSRVALEWMASGRPVIATRVGCLPEIVSEGTGFLVAPQDAPALAQGLAKLCNDSALRQRMAQRARVQAEKFSLPAFIERTEKLYRQACNESAQC